MPRLKIAGPSETVTRVARAAAGILFFGWSVMAPGQEAAAQTTTTGSLGGYIVDESGQPLDGVFLALERDDEARVIEGLARRDGTFAFPFLSPGPYSLQVERIGFVPVRVVGIVVRPDQSVTLRVQLRPQAPPVGEIDRITANELSVGTSATVGMTMTALRSHLPSAAPGIEVMRLLSPFQSEGIGGRGLPGTETGIRVDGIPLSAPPRSDGIRNLGPATFVPLAALSGIRATGTPDDPGGGATSGMQIRAVSRPGPPRQQIELTLGATHALPGAGSAWSGVDAASPLPDVSFRIGGPLVPDTLLYHLIVEISRSPEVSTGATGSSATELARLFETSGAWAQPVGQPVRLTHRDHLSVFGRVDWTPGGQRSLAVRGGVHMTRADGWGPGLLVPDPGSAESRSVGGWIGAGFLNPFGDASALEVGIGMESVSRSQEFADSGTGTQLSIHRGAVQTGLEREASGSHRRSGLTLAPTIHHMGERHRIRTGLGLGFFRVEAEDRIAPGRSLYLPRIDDDDAIRGLFVQAMGRKADAGYTGARMSLFVEDRWTPAPGLTLTGSISVDRQSLPIEEFARNVRWEDVSGVDFSAVAEPSTELEPRLAIEWRPEGRAGIQVRGSAGIHRGAYDPALLLEVLSDTGSVVIDRALGTLGSWSSGPNATQAFESRGVQATILGPRFAPPRTRSLELEMSALLGRNTRVGIAVDHRHTDFLPRVRDLNRVPGAFAFDALGRAIHGEIVRRGELIGVRPGSDRRFDGFDQVRAIESDGWSRWLGVTLSARHETPGRLAVGASYTRSETVDTTPMSPWGDPLLVRARSGADVPDPRWLEGPSDFHRPDNLRLEGQLHGPAGIGLVLGGVFVLESGAPFTPTVRDLLGGTSGLGRMADEPISIPADLVAEVASLESNWPCLRDLRDGERRRNACRTAAVQRLDLRLGLDLPLGMGASWTLQFDARDLLEGTRGIPDSALFLIDGTQSFSVDPVSGAADLPFVVNPDFGRNRDAPIPGRSFRIGATVRF